MNNFTASNGVRIRVRDAYLEYASGPENTAWTDVTSFALGSQVGVAVREFFQAEEDGRLGRWRWPEEPDYVVYPAANGCLVLLELAGDTFFLHRDFLDGEDEPTRAARAYFEAHPEPKPWHDAAVGDAWVLNTGMGDIVFSVVQVSRGGEPIFVFTRGTAFGRAEQLHVDDPGIQSGRRIWPEVSS